MPTAPRSTGASTLRSRRARARSSWVATAPRPCASSRGFISARCAAARSCAANVSKCRHAPLPGITKSSSTHQRARTRSAAWSSTSAACPSRTSTCTPSRPRTAMRAPTRSVASRCSAAASRLRRSRSAARRTTSTAACPGSRSRGERRTCASCCAATRRCRCTSSTTRAASRCPASRCACGRRTNARATTRAFAAPVTIIPAALRSFPEWRAATACWSSNRTAGTCGAAIPSRSRRR
jgi:hypothetical protein